MKRGKQTLEEPGVHLETCRRMESVKMRPVTKREYRRMEFVGEGEELDEAEWLHRADAQSQRRRRGQRYAFCCALFASLNGILLGYGQSMHASPSHFLYMLYTSSLQFA
ncbi:unnamed protein product [Urochloa humidicola]